MCSRLKAGLWPISNIKQFFSKKRTERETRTRPCGEQQELCFFYCTLVSVYKNNFFINKLAVNVDICFISLYSFKTICYIFMVLPCLVMNPVCPRFEVTHRSKTFVSLDSLYGKKHFCFSKGWVFCETVMWQKLYIKCAPPLPTVIM